MKKDDGSESTVIIGPSKSVLVYALHSLEYVLGLARFRVFVPKIIIIDHFIANWNKMFALNLVVAVENYLFTENLFYSEFLVENINRSVKLLVKQ